MRSRARCFQPQMRLTLGLRKKRKILSHLIRKAKIANCTFVDEVSKSIDTDTSLCKYMMI